VIAMLSSASRVVLATVDAPTANEKDEAYELETTGALAARIIERRDLDRLRDLKR
jgi:hypothetical protein